MDKQKNIDMRTHKGKNMPTIRSDLKPDQTSDKMMPGQKPYCQMPLSTWSVCERDPRHVTAAGYVRSHACPCAPGERRTPGLLQVVRRNDLTSCGKKLSGDYRFERRFCWVNLHAILFFMRVRCKKTNRPSDLPASCYFLSAQTFYFFPSSRYLSLPWDFL